MINMISTLEARKHLREESEIEALLSPSEVADYLKITRQAVHKRLIKNDIPHESEGRPGRKEKLIHVEDFLNWLYFERDVHEEIYRKKMVIIKNAIIKMERILNYGNL